MKESENPENVLRRIEMQVGVYSSAEGKKIWGNA